MKDNQGRNRTQKRAHYRCPRCRVSYDGPMPAYLPDDHTAIISVPCLLCISMMRSFGGVRGREKPNQPFLPFPES